MRTVTRRRGTAAAAAAGALLCLLTACAEEAVSPLPVQPPTATTATLAPSAASAPSASSASPRPTPARTRSTDAVASATTSPSRSTACLGPVRYVVPVDEQELALLKSLCLATGGILRLEGIGPGLVTVDRPDLVSLSYEAGIVDVRFVRAGTVTVTVPYEGRTYRITVVAG